MAKSAALYDHAKSKASDGEEARMAQRAKAGGGDKEPDKKDAKEPEGEGDGAADAKNPAGEPEEEGGGKKDMFLDGLKNIQKRHETERRDTHGNHREAMRQMHNRHNKEIADHFDLHFGEGTDSSVEGAERAQSQPPGQGGEPVAEE